ncbi:MAG: hypothetical protein H0T75_12755, partial [Rhizobiales bacterium]|nr:hypothetical protein [Hyphomicrobiales bacterium]
QEHLRRQIGDDEANSLSSEPMERFHRLQCVIDARVRELELLICEPAGGVVVVDCQTRARDAIVPGGALWQRNGDPLRRGKPDMADAHHRRRRILCKSVEARGHQPDNQNQPEQAD